MYIIVYIFEKAMNIRVHFVPNLFWNGYQKQVLVKKAEICSKSCKDTNLGASAKKGHFPQKMFEQIFFF